jgi:hypothetical protein
MIFCKKECKNRKRQEAYLKATMVQTSQISRRKWISRFKKSNYSQINESKEVYTESLYNQAFKCQIQTETVYNWISPIKNIEWLSRLRKRNTTICYPQESHVRFKYIFKQKVEG